MEGKNGNSILVSASNALFGNVSWKIKQNKGY